MKISTTKLKSLTTKAMAGATQNKLIPITGLMCIKAHDNELVMITTDAVNFLYVWDEVECEDFYAVVPVNLFSNLVSRLSSMETELTVKDGVLIVEGNGTYKIELPLDESGNQIKYKDPKSHYDIDEGGYAVSMVELRNIITIARPSLATTLDIPVLMNYYFGDTVVTSDQCNICSINEKLFDTTVLMSPNLFRMVDTITADEVVFFKFEDNVVIFDSPNMTVVGRCEDTVDEFPYDAVQPFVTETFNSRCNVSKSSLIALLERVALFVSEYDKNTVNLHFTADGIEVASKHLSSIEKIDYIDSEGFKDYSCDISVVSLLSQVKAYPNNTVTIEYGNDKSIKLVYNSVVQVLALSA